ncbi:Hpt domain-containing protein [Sphingorhabdus soli]|uniref:Hpt domain-containing protein n=1 Tax=Flavisphingopyxis soli TaxID=2601267 RepID=A0A5C6U5J4_9SPHN|nr:Hpt domain-containing protein [Sphingorhabdus soli]TXC68104.1 Hpt domain-containing protein [Sphingorhabdus soli]
MGTEPEQLVDWTVYRAARSGLGGGFVRILGYFREDGIKSVAAIEQAMREKNAAALVLPSHTLKGESRQFGADRLASLAEDIEMFARECVEDRSPPDEYLQKVVALRPLFEETLDALETEANPLVQRQRPAFGRSATNDQLLGRG